MGQLVERPLRHELAVADHDDLVDRLGHLGQHVARDQDRAAVGGLGAQEVAQPAYALRVEAVGGLVEHERARVAQQRPGQAQPLAHAERVALHSPPAGAVQLNEPEHLVDPACRETRRAGQDPQMVATRPPGVELRTLEHCAHHLHGILQGAVRLAVDHRRARARQGEAEQRAQRRGLAGAVRAEEAEHPAGGGLEAEPVHRDVGAEALGQVADLEHAGHASGGTGASGAPQR
jgi:hypothetical protein